MPRLFERAPVAVLALAVSLLGAACGSSAPSASSSTTSAASGRTTTSAAPVSSEVKAFCDAHLALAKALSGPPDDSVDVGALASTFQRTAPADLKDTVGTFLEVAQRAGEQGDDSVFLSDEFRKPQHAIESAIADRCGYPVHEVKAVDYGFDGLPASVQPGPTVFHFVNGGHDLHEALLYRRADGVTGDPVDLLNADPSGESGDLEEVGVVHIGPAGDDAYLNVDLEPGAYVVACFFPQGVTAADQLATASKDPKMDHRSAGMIAGFEVARG